MTDRELLADCADLLESEGHRVHAAALRAYAEKRLAAIQGLLEGSARVVSCIVCGDETFPGNYCFCCPCLDSFNEEVAKGRDYLDRAVYEAWLDCRRKMYKMESVKLE